MKKIIIATSSEENQLLAKICTNQRLDNNAVDTLNFPTMVTLQKHTRHSQPTKSEITIATSPATA
jgi:hypothetical protein